MFAAAIYSFGYFLELNCVSYDTLLLVRNFEFLGMVLIPSFGTLFIAKLAKVKLTKKITCILFTVSAMIWLLFITNPLHHLIYKSIELRIIGGFNVIDVVRGLGFYSLVAYYILFLILSSIILLKSYRKSKNTKYKNSVRFLFVSLQLTWFTVLFILLGFDTYINPVPATIIIVCVLFGINEIRNDMFELQINRWKSIFDNIGQPAFLLNVESEIVCTNIMAKSLISQFKKNIRDIIIDVENTELNSRLAFFTINNETRWFDIRKNNFDTKNKFTNYLFIDITQRKCAEDALKESEKKYRLIFEHIPLGMLHFDKNGIIKDCNDNFIKIIGSSRKCLVGLDITKLPDKKIVEALEGTLEGQITTYEGDYKSVTADKLTPTRVLFAPIPSDDKKVEEGIGIIEDITQRKSIENLLRASEEKYRLLTEQTSDVITVLNLTKGKFTYISPSMFYLRGFTAEEAMNESLEEALTPESLVVIRENIERKTKEFIDNPNTSTEHICEIQQPCKNGDIIWVELSIKYRYNADGDIETIGVSRNIEERKKSEKEILYLSYNDQLTGLYNRRFYEKELKRLDVEKNLPLTIVMADVNGLKLTNDAFGHAMGDELLKKVAEVIRKGCRVDDIVARLAGDEFVIILPNSDDIETEKVIKRINDLALKEKVDFVNISISFGYETKKNQEQKIGEILKKAEDHMYKKKLFESPSMRGKTINIIINTLHEKNKREEVHSYRVSKLCQRMGEALNLLEGEIKELKTVGLLHDIGKIAIEENILNKPGKLTEDEWEEIKRHPEIGYRILSTVNDMSEMAEYVLAHHEAWDGNGYPKGLKGIEIPFVSRIIAIADTYDAMTSDRSYRNALPEEVAIEELLKNSGIQFDPELVTVFIEKVLGKASRI